MYSLSQASPAPRARTLAMPRNSSKCLSRDCLAELVVAPPNVARRSRLSKILATLGPQTTEQQIIDFFDAGADLFRINMSHMKERDHRVTDMVNAIRKVSSDLGVHIGVLVDLQGPKIRCGSFANGPYVLERGQSFTFDMELDTPGDRTRVGLPHPEIFKAIEVGHNILVNDGAIAMRVDAVDRENLVIETTVTQEGEINNRKGVNVPDTLLPMSAMTTKDRRDLAFALEHSPDWIALSFVQTASDVQECQAMVQGRARVMAKIEKPQALENLVEIVEAANGIMVARGDLGVELSLSQVPAAQKRCIKLGQVHGKPVVVATQMLESMISRPVPTRAEVNDVACAVYDGADCLMLSAETAIGKFPRKAVRTMSDCIWEVQKDPLYLKSVHAIAPGREHLSTPDAIAAASRLTVKALAASVIVVYTRSGGAALRISRERPSALIVAMTPVLETARALSAVWGVRAVHLKEDAKTFKDMTRMANAVVTGLEVAFPGDSVVCVSGWPFGQQAINLMHVLSVTEPEMVDGHVGYRNPELSHSNEDLVHALSATELNEG
ncbi:Pyruvate kinase [Carpediemonas membranifera]|uniref:Pyruvate kinase n=1 Tax=Carpediemonas membranifera TaxID=201153 RepID=A0A8J6E312_9EUKA|nr:Pyruvate kinase [Carpediemonas membranifera]|eukprot:KAG9395006.1 Pyruvate kinase [Carpediemonas membranifera]